MQIKIVKVERKKELRKFIHLPAKIHERHSNWVPPLYMDDNLFFNSARNRSFQYCDAILYLAYDGSRVAGRIMGIINHRYNKTHHEEHARFGFLECWNEPEVAAALLKAVEDWARARGMTHVVGPLGFSDKDPQGYLIEGFDETMVLSTNCNFSYVNDLLEMNLYKKKIDLVVYKIDIPDKIPSFYTKVYERVVASNRITVEEFTQKKQLKTQIRPVLNLVNQTFSEIYGFDAMTGEEMDALAGRFLSILDPRFLKVIRNETGEHIAFVLGMPDISKGIIRSGGYLLPLGLFYILRSARRTKQLNLLLGAVREDYRNAGLDAVMAVKIIGSAIEAGMKYIDSHLELEDNVKVRAEMERFGGKVYKRFRIYQKQL